METAENMSRVTCEWLLCMLKTRGVFVFLCIVLQFGFHGTDIYKHMAQRDGDKLAKMAEKNGNGKLRTELILRSWGPHPRGTSDF